MDPTDSSSGYGNGWDTTAGFNQVCAESCSYAASSSFTETTYSTSSLFGD